MWRLFRVPVVIRCVILVWLGILTHCRKPEKPAHILSKEQLSSLMVQMYLAESKLNGYNIPRDSAIKLFLPFEEALLRKYNISDSQLHQTYQYYFDHPEELELVYDAVIDSLSLRERLETSRPTPSN
jgi:hypothetical protein